MRTKTYQVIRPFDNHRAGDRVTPADIGGNELRELALQAQGLIRLVSAPSKPREAASTPKPTPTPINLNSATEKGLMSLNGVGEHRAELILSQRPFSDTETAIELYPFLGDIPGWTVE